MSRAVRLSLLLLGCSAAPTFAGDVTIFGSIAEPAEVWSHGYGATLSSQWFQVVALEIEAARQPGSVTDTSMTTFTGSALIAPPIGPLRPYGGFGVGLFRQSIGTLSDTGTLSCFVLGLKLHLGGVLVIKGDYRHFNLSGDASMPLDHRYALGVGVSF
jgi:hypothetical protein